MKKLTLIIVLLATVSIQSVSAYTLIFSRYTRGGTIMNGPMGEPPTVGYGDVYSNWDIIEGTYDTYIIRTISCTNGGSKLCPQYMVRSETPEGFATIDINACNDLNTYVKNQVAINNLTGTHTITVYNSSTSETYYYKVSWSFNSSSIDSDSVSGPKIPTV